MSATVTTILDQMHTINQTVTTNSLNHARYFSSNLLTRTPIVVPFYGSATYPDAPGTQRAQATEGFQIALYGGSLVEGIIGETAARATEPILEALADAYLTRPQLEVAGVPLDGVTKCHLGSRIVEPNEDNLLIVVFTVNITYRKTIAYNTA